MIAAILDRRALVAELLQALRAFPDVTADRVRQVDAARQAAVNDVSASMQVKVFHAGYPHPHFSGQPCLPDYPPSHHFASAREQKRKMHRMRAQDDLLL